MDENERKNVTSALLVVVLSIAAFVAYFANLGVVFWIIAVLALVSGFYMAYILSKEGRQQGSTPAPKKKGS